MIRESKEQNSRDSNSLGEHLHVRQRNFTTYKVSAEAVRPYLKNSNVFSK